MRQRLFHQILAVIVVVAVLAELAMAVAFGVSLRSGFGDYTTARDRADLMRFSAALEAELAATSGSAPQTATAQTLWPILHKPALNEAANRGNSSAPDWVLHPPMGPDMPPPGSGAKAAVPPAFANGWLEPVPVGAPPQRTGGLPEAFEARVQIFDTAGKQIFGPPATMVADGLGKMLDSRIKRNGRDFVQIKLIPLDQSDTSAGNRFLADQFRHAVVIGVIILALCTALAVLVARLVTRRLDAIQQATRAIANGDFSVVLPENGAIEVAETISNINTMTASLQRLELARRRWLADVSHELRTPLAALRGELDAMLDGVRPVSHGGLSSLNEEVLRLNDLVEDLHLLAIADLDGPVCHFAQADAGLICQATVARFAEQALAQALELRIEGGGETIPVTWDAQRMEQTLANLLTNSMRYTDSPGTIRVAIEPTGERVRIVVEDSAPCPLLDDLPHLFEPLYRVEAHRSRMTGGSGLGLAICEAIVRRHQGAIKASMSELGGLRVELDLPRIAGNS